MKLLRNIKYLLILIAVLGLASCGSEREYKKREQALIQAISAGGTPLTDAEMAVSLRICYAFRSKHTTFKAEQVGKGFRFKVDESFCDNRKEQEFINTVVSDLGLDRPLEYSSSSSRPYFKTIMTNVFGPIKSICDEVLRGNTPSNVITVSQDEVMEVRFINSVYDEFEVRYGRKVKFTDVNYKPYKVENFKVLTNSLSSGNLLGLVTESSRKALCDDGLTERTTLQTYAP